MKQISPAFDSILTRWTASLDSLKKEISFQKDLLTSEALALNGHQLANRERYTQDCRETQRLWDGQETPWNERLRQVETWQESLLHWRHQFGTFHTLVDTTSWFKKLMSRLHVLVGRFNRCAVALQDQHIHLNKDLNLWHNRLTQEQNQEWIRFLQDQQETELTLGHRLRVLRGSLNHQLGRIQRVLAAVSSRAGENPDLFAKDHFVIHQLLTALETALHKQRESVLADSLHFEACRRLFREVKARKR